ncbi:ATP-dependent dethiobiotin synthetase BioD 1 [invertebrate metagenome]|uniref:ATP-dependent dethiobiotin synthetase BioD 1 n=1 Tax=invertebrate metagenome TaxID=1711999 RepID=A0A2H9T9C6_9ZZZZ
MHNTFFVTGTDTDAGKTVASCGLLEAARLAGLSTLALKPVSAGCYVTPEGLRNQDAVELMAAMSSEAGYEQVNPVAVEPAIAPHIAIAMLNLDATTEQLHGKCRQTIESVNADFTLIEGAGGWLAPLNRYEMISDLAKSLNIPVIMVVNMKLGCLNHATLTARTIAQDGLVLKGWIANTAEVEMEAYQENLATLKQTLSAPCIGEIPWMPACNPTAVARFLDVQALLS